MVSGVDLVAWMFELQVGPGVGSGGAGHRALPAKMAIPYNHGRAAALTLSVQVAITPFTSMETKFAPRPPHPLQGAPGDDLPPDLATYQPCMAGQAIEVRICAEDPAHNYRPCTGTLGLVAWPKRTECRVDTWVETGVEVSGGLGAHRLCACGAPPAWLGRSGRGRVL